MTREFVTLSLGEKDWVFRALDLDQIEQLEPEFADVTMLAVSEAGSLPKAGLRAVAAIAQASLAYKHPEMTVEQCRKLITLGTMQTVLEAIRGISGLEQTPGEAAARVVA